MRLNKILIGKKHIWKKKLFMRKFIKDIRRV